MAAANANSSSSSSSNSNLRKKSDEKHLKILRELVGLPCNRTCFDCSQRGPTYVNTTIGSFVCTKCSGLLRGLTPPHRVKSISMATFTSEEIEFLKTRGNEYCKKVWLALYDSSNSMQDIKDEQHIKDFMTAKYERKRYYMEPSMNLRNGHGLSLSKSSSPSPTPTPTSSVQKSTTPLSNPTVVASGKLPVLQQPAANVFGSPDVHKTSASTNFDPFGLSSPPVSSQPPMAFANFDDNPIFQTASGPSLPTSISFQSALKTKPLSPIEDKYAALKDLDCLMKMQQETGSNSSSSTDWPTQPTVTNPFQKGVEKPSNPFLNGGLDLWPVADSSNKGSLTSSQSMSFPNNNHFTPVWPNTSGGNLTTVTTSKSANPFL